MRRVQPAMMRIPAFALVLGLAACGGSTGPVPTTTGTEVILEIGQSSVLDGTGISVSLKNVEDSRCRPDVVCIWEGNATVALDLRDRDGAEIIGELNTHPDYVRSLTFRFLRIELLSLDPLPPSTQSAVRYRAHLRWSYLPD